MLQVLIFVCALSVQPGDCDEHTANSVMSGGKVAMPTQCMMMGQVVPAGTAVGPDDKFYTKVQCRREKA